MRKTIRYIAFAGVAHLIAWTTVTAQIGVDSLPEGLPTDDIEYLGDNQFSSGVFGDFELDTTNNKRVIHEILGPMVWDWDEETEIVTLHTEWYGALYTHVPGVSEEKMHASGLGFIWPLVKSEITGFIYHVKVDADMTDPERAPFFNHREVDGEPVGWQRSIGVDLHSAENYYKSAEVVVGQMQQVLQNMVNAQEAYVNLPVSIAAGQGPIDNQFEQLNAMFLNLHDLYTKFVFYYHRCSMAPVWAERDERPQAEIDLAQAYVNHLPQLTAIVELDVYPNAQKILYTNAVSIKTAKMNQLNQLIAEEEARRKAEEEANKGGGSSGGSSGGGSSGGGSSGGGSSGGGSSGPVDPVNVDEDAISWSNVTFANSNRIQGNIGQVAGWPATAQLKGLRIAKSGVDYYGYWDVSGAARWPNIISAGEGSVRKGVNGNSWIFVPYNGKWIASPYEGFIGSRPPTATHTMGNLNIPHPNSSTNYNHREKILKGGMLGYNRTDVWGTSNGTPKSGTTYGWMVSTNAGLYKGIGSYGKARSNIILVPWP